MSRDKGNRTVNKAIDYYENQGYIVDRVELGGRFTKSKDLFSSDHFGGFDLVALKPGTLLLIQVKTNTPATHGPYEEFAKKYSSRNIQVIQCVWYDRRGWVFYRYNKTGGYRRTDLRT